MIPERNGWDEIESCDWLAAYRAFDEDEMEAVKIVPACECRTSGISHVLFYIVAYSQC